MGYLPNGEYTNIPEEWFPLTDFFIPGIKPWYEVSNYGRIYNKFTDRFIPQDYRENEYRAVSLSFKDGTSRNFELHRVVALIYCWNGPDFDYTKDVNHRDGVKGHNWAWNLEWCTHKENLDHCIDTGLMPLGEDRDNSIFTNEQVDIICRLISEGKSNKEIKDIMQIQEGNISKLIQNIKNGHCWKHVSKNHDFSNAKTKSMLTNEDKHKICTYFQYNGTDISYKNILDYIGYDYSDLSKDELSCLNSTICYLRKKFFKENKYQYDNVYQV